MLRNKEIAQNVPDRVRISLCVCLSLSLSLSPHFLHLVPSPFPPPPFKSNLSRVKDPISSQRSKQLTICLGILDLKTFLNCRSCLECDKISSHEAFTKNNQQDPTPLAHMASVLLLTESGHLHILSNNLNYSSLLITTSVSSKHPPKYQNWIIQSH